MAGLGMGLGHFIAANFLSYELTAVFASLLSFVALTIFMQFWQPHTPQELHSTTGNSKFPISRAILGLFPYILVVVILAIAKLWKFGINLPALLKATDIQFNWPGVYGVLVDETGKPAKSGIFTLTWLYSPGTMLLITGIIVVFVYAHFGKLAIAATAIKKPGSEAELLRTAFPISALLLVCLGLITLLASLGPLAFVITGG